MQWYTNFQQKCKGFYIFKKNNFYKLGYLIWVLYNWLKIFKLFSKKKYRLSKSLNLIGNILNEELGMASIDWNEWLYRYYLFIKTW